MKRQIARLKEYLPVINPYQIDRMTRMKVASKAEVENSNPGLSLRRIGTKDDIPVFPAASLEGSRELLGFFIDDFDEEFDDDDFDDEFDDEFEELPDDEFDDFGEGDDEELEDIEIPEEEFETDLDDGDGFEDFDDLDSDENSFDDTSDDDD